MSPASGPCDSLQLPAHPRSRDSGLTSTAGCDNFHAGHSDLNLAVHQLAALAAQSDPSRPSNMATKRATPTLLRDPVYMVDFAVFKPDDELKIDLTKCSDSAWRWRHPDGEVSRRTVRAKHLALGSCSTVVSRLPRSTARDCWQCAHHLSTSCLPNYCAICQNCGGPARHAAGGTQPCGSPHQHFVTTFAPDVLQFVGPEVHNFVKKVFQKVRL